MLRQLRSSPFLIVILIFVVLWFFVRPAAAGEAQKLPGSSILPDPKFNQLQKLIEGVSWAIGGSANNGQNKPVIAPLRSDWVGLKIEDQTFSDLYRQTDKKILFCGAAFDCENYQQGETEVQCLAEQRPTKPVNAGLIKDADQMDIDLKALSSKAKVQICNRSTPAIAKLGIPVSPDKNGATCRLEGYDFGKKCSEIYISVDGVECYYQLSKVGPTKPSRFSELQVARALMAQFSFRSTVKLAELIKHPENCNSFERKVLVESFETFRAAASQPAARSTPVAAAQLGPAAQ